MYAHMSIISFLSIINKPKRAEGLCSLPVLGPRKEFWAHARPPLDIMPRSAFQGQVPLLSLPALEQIHVFIFVLAITHVVLSAITVLLGLLQVISSLAYIFHITF